MELTGCKARGVLGLPGSEMGRSTLPYLRSLMKTPNTLSTNCGEWKRVAYYVYELSARQVSERPHGEALRRSLSRKSSLDLGNIASVAAYARFTHNS